MDNVICIENLPVDLSFVHDLISAALARHLEEIIRIS